MLKKKLMITAIAVLSISNGQAIEQMWATDQAAQETREQERIYGSQLMTDRERAEYREKIHAAGSEEQRAAIRSEHHALMQERAKARGITLPDMPRHDMDDAADMQHDHKMHN